MKFKLEINTITRQILSWTCFPDNYEEDGAVFAPEIFRGLCYEQDGRVVEVPPQPSPAHTWNWQTKTWDLDLSLAKSQARSRIKAARTAVITAPLVTPHGTFQCDAASSANILKVSLFAQNLAAQGMPSDVEFTLADNTRPTFTMAQITSVAMLMGMRESASYNTAQALLEQIELATTAQEIDAIQWLHQPD